MSRPWRAMAVAASPGHPMFEPRRRRACRLGIDTRDCRTFMPHELVSAPTEDGHYTGLRSVMQAFADVRDSASLPLGGVR